MYIAQAQSKKRISPFQMHLGKNLFFNRRTMLTITASPFDQELSRQSVAEEMAALFLSARASRGIKLADGIRGHADNTPKLDLV